MNAYEPWVLEWLDKQRRSGIKGLEIKYLNNKYYVYKSTSYWDKSLRKIRKNQHTLAGLTRKRD